MSGSDFNVGNLLIHAIGGKMHMVQSHRASFM